MGAFVSSFDPFAVDRGTAKTLDEALSGAAVAVIATAHRTFLTLTPEFFEAHGVKTVIDGRNCLPEERFESSRVMYRGIGRGYPTNNKPAELAEPASDKREHLTPIMSQ
jgi:UDP-N-acetyl-D-mannosaminuronate dehydrogenase